MGGFQVIVFDFQPVNPESAEAAVSIISGKSVPGSDSQTIISNVILKVQSRFHKVSGQRECSQYYDF